MGLVGLGFRGGVLGVGVYRRLFLGFHGGFVTSCELRQVDSLKGGFGRRLLGAPAWAKV